MQCGEKDPFVDDTVIFASRIREAKRARKHELELAVAGQSAKFGEALRMSASAAPGTEEALRQMARELDKLKEESEEVWVQMQIYSDWSHGYLQMPTLLKEAQLVIDDIADWIDDVFGARGDNAALGSDPVPLSRVTADIGIRRRSPNRNTPRSTNEHRTSESEVTESDADDPITFVSKRNPRPSFAGSDDTAVTARRGIGVSLRDSDETLGDDQTPMSGQLTDKELASPEGNKEALSNLGQHATHGTKTADDDGGRANLARAPATPGKTGQTISEVELMRRRRLLDSHIFASAPQ
jgi:hypothetical protein